MGKIYYMMGKSSSGKDTIYKDIRKDLPELKTLTLYTTRPMREGEKDGVEYYFVTDEILEKYREEGKIIELRTYQTVYGDWKYATIDDGQINLDENDYLMIGTLESYQKDFSEDNLKKAGITRRYQNDDKVRCKEEIVEVIRDGKL